MEIVRIHYRVDEGSNIISYFSIDFQDYYSRENLLLRNKSYVKMAVNSEITHSSLVLFSLFLILAFPLLLPILDRYYIPEADEIKTQKMCSVFDGIHIYTTTTNGQLIHWWTITIQQ